MKPLRKSVFQCEDKNQPNYCRKTCWKAQPLIFTVYLMNHIFQLCVLFIYGIIECIEFNWLYKHINKVKRSQAVILVLNWIKHIFSLWVSLRKDFYRASPMAASGHSSLLFSNFSITPFRSSRRMCSLKKAVLKLKICNIHRKIPLLEPLFNKFTVKARNFIKKRLQRRCFPVNILVHQWLYNNMCFSFCIDDI